MRILLLEDESTIRDTYVFMLERLGHEVTPCSDPGSCELPCLQCGRCPDGLPCRDVIISDIYMPVQSGLDFIRQLRGYGCPVKHVALISGAWSCRDLAEARGLQCAIFEKPFRIQELESWLSECR